MKHELAVPAKSESGGALDMVAFSRVTKVALKVAGLSIPESKRAMVQSRLARRLRATGFEDFTSYLDHIESSNGQVEREEMISALTTNVSHFFREDHHFKALRDDILPDLLARAQSGGRVRIWSAGCSTGQEPYSLAMTLLDAQPRASDLDVRILATDIDLRVLSSAKAGKYDERQIASVPSEKKSSYFQEVTVSGEVRFEAKEKLKEMIAFRELNLMNTWPMTGPFDAIFCRNVVIYFSEETQATLWPRFNQKLTSSGYLFLGHSERIQDPSANGFEAIGVTTYRRNSS